MGFTFHVALRDEFLDALFPPRCYLCNCAADDGLACAAHAPVRENAAARCARCAARLGRGLPDGSICASCRIEPPSFSHTLSLGDYHDPALREWILAFKHGGRRDLAWPIALLLAERVLASGRGGDIDLLVPVPLHALRRFERGYDQARLLAESLARRLAIPWSSALSRRRWTPPQGGAGSVSRAANVRDAFRPAHFAARRVRGKRVWLVDDVVTSGATAHECSLALKRMGAREVGVLCLARAARADFGEPSEYDPRP